MIFGIKEKINNFDPYNVFLAIATYIPVLLMTAFVLQGHILYTEDEDSYTKLHTQKLQIFTRLV